MTTTIQSELVMSTIASVDDASAQRLTRLAELPKGWDSYGAEPVDRDSIELAAMVLLMVHGLSSGELCEPFIAPLPDGGIEIDWEASSQNELMLVIPPEGGNIQYLLEERSAPGEPSESEGLIPRDASLSEVVRRVIG